MTDVPNVEFTNTRRCFLVTHNYGPDLHKQAHTRGIVLLREPTRWGRLGGRCRCHSGYLAESSSGCFDHRHRVCGRGLVAIGSSIRTMADRRAARGLAAGVAVGLTTRNTIAESLNSEVALKAVEIILAILLFVDATEVRSGPLGHHPAAAVRVLLIALPLSLIASVGLGSWLLPDFSWPVLLVIACVVTPIDFAPTGSILRGYRISTRVRGILNVEAGYSDGIVSPIIIFALTLADGLTQATTPTDALRAAVPASIKAILVGTAVGLVLAFLAGLAERARTMNVQSKRLILVAAPCSPTEYLSAFTATASYHPSSADWPSVVFMTNQNLRATWSCSMT